MKTKLVILLLVIGYAACKKDEKKETSTSGPCKVATTNYENGSNESYEYLPDGRLSKFTFTDQGEVKTSTYTYGTNSVSVRTEIEGVLDAIEIYTLDAKGNAIQMIKDYYYPPLYGNTPTRTTKFTYEYDANGYLIKKVIGETSPETSVYIWNDGNLQRIDIGSGYHERKFTYHTDKSNVFGVIERLKSFLGNPSKNLVKTDIEVAGPLDHNNSFTYEFDGSGNVAKRIKVDKNNKSTTATYTWKCQ